MSTTHAPVLVILAGGQSQRMGRDKALLPWKGKTISDHLLACGLACGLDCAFSGTQRPGFDPALQWIPDIQAGQGPLAGIAACLAALQQSILVVSCDAPCMTPDAMNWLLEHIQHYPTADIIMPQSAQGPEPCFAYYHLRALHVIQTALDQGRRSPRRLAQDPCCQLVPIPTDFLEALCNINDPQTYQRVYEKWHNSAPFSEP